MQAQRALLTVFLVGTRLKRWEDGHPRVAALNRRDGGSPVMVVPGVRYLTRGTKITLKTVRCARTLQVALSAPLTVIGPETDAATVAEERDMATLSRTASSSAERVAAVPSSAGHTPRLRRRRRAGLRPERWTRPTYRSGNRTSRRSRVCSSGAPSNARSLIGPAALNGPAVSALTSGFPA